MGLREGGGGALFRSVALLLALYFGRFLEAPQTLPRLLAQPGPCPSFSDPSLSPRPVSDPWLAPAQVYDYLAMIAAADQRADAAAIWAAAQASEAQASAGEGGGSNDKALWERDTAVALLLF